MGNIAKHNEQLFIDLIRQGYLYIDSTGAIWRKAIKHPRNTYIVIRHRRAEHKTIQGYYQLRLRKDGKEYSCMAHRLIWYCLHGKIPDGLEINHKNGTKDDNRLCNLEIVSSSFNQKHAYRVLGRKPSLGTAVLKETEVLEIRELKKSGLTNKQLAQNYGVSYGHICKIVGDRAWKRIGNIHDSEDTK